MTEPLDHAAVDRRHRWRSRAVVVVVLLIAVPVLARVVAVDDLPGLDVALDQAEPTSPPDAKAPTPGSVAGEDGPPETAAPTPAVVELLDATVGVALEGPLAHGLELEPGPEEASTTTALGYPVTAWTEVVIRATSAAPVQLPEAPAGPDGAAWTAEGGGLRVAISPAREAQVLAGGPPGTTGVVVAGGEVPPWLPRTLVLQVESTDLVTDDATREVAVPFGDSTIRVTVTFTPSTAPAPLPLLPADAAVGTVVDVPEEGHADVVLLDDGIPVWISHTDHHGISVVDGRSPFRPSGIIQLVRWCPSSQGFDEAFGGSRFTAEGTYAFGPAPTGLTTYAVEPAGEGQVRIAAGAAGGPRPPPVAWPPLTGVEGYPVDPGPVFAGPFCDAVPEGVPDVEPASLRPVSPPLDAYPYMDVATLEDAVAQGWTGRVLVDGRIMVDEAGRGRLCAPSPEPPGCVDGIPVDLRAGGGAIEPGRYVAYDARMVISLEDGVVVEAWMDGSISGVEVDAGGTTIPAVRYAITRVLGVRTGQEAAGYDCGHVSAARPCPAVLDAEELTVVTAGDPVHPPGRVNLWSPLPAHAEEALAAGRLPDGWVVTDEVFADGDARTTLLLADADVLPDGTPLADIPLGRLVVVIERNRHVTAVVLLEAS